MPDINFNCQHCGKSLQIDAKGGDMRVQCPDCGNAITVPQPLNPPPSSRIAKPRPTSVTVFGVLNIVFGGLGLLCTPFGMIATFVLPDFLNQSPGFRNWLILSYVIGLACTIWLLVLGIGLLNLKRWSRRGSIAYGWFAIVFGIIGMIVRFGALAGGGLSPSGEAIPGFIGGIFGGLIGLAYPIVLLVFMNKPAAVESCTK